MLKSLARLSLAALALMAWSCEPAEMYAPPPSGIPDTPYWFVAGDSVLWYMSADSLALAQMAKGASSNAKSAVLYALRDLGWRMTVNRGPALRRPNDEQALGQELFQLERADDAISLVTGRGQIENQFWSSDMPAGKATLQGVMPAVRFGNDTLATYLWPGYLAVVWNEEPTATEALALLDSLGCTTITTPQHRYSYYVHRTWSVRLPPGAELFRWLRMFNADPRIRLAIPIAASFDPPSADQRMVRTVKGNVHVEPEAFSKLAAPVKQAYYISHFSESTETATVSTKVPAKFNLLKLVITTRESSEQENEEIIRRLDGELISHSSARMVAWIPYSNIPALASEPQVTQIQPVRQK